MLFLTWWTGHGNKEDGWEGEMDILRRTRSGFLYEDCQGCNVQRKMKTVILLGMITRRKYKEEDWIKQTFQKDVCEDRNKGWYKQICEEREVEDNYNGIPVVNVYYVKEEVV